MVGTSGRQSAGGKRRESRRLVSAAESARRLRGYAVDIATEQQVGSEPLCGLVSRLETAPVHGAWLFGVQDATVGVWRHGWAIPACIPRGTASRSRRRDAARPGGWGTTLTNLYLCIALLRAEPRRDARLLVAARAKQQRIGGLGRGRGFRPP